MTLKTLGLGAAFVLAPMVAQASTVTGTFDATTSISDRRGGAHAFWFEVLWSATLDNNFVLSEPGTFTADDDGATFTGSVENRDVAGAGFDLSFIYDRDFSDNAMAPEFKANDALVGEHGNEDYFDFEGGTATGTGSLTGLNFELVRAPANGQYVLQVGGGLFDFIGANNLNSNFGASGWMQISAVDASGCSACDASFDYSSLIGTQTDITIDLAPAAVPLPAAGFLLFGALVGAGGIARRRKA